MASSSRSQSEPPCDHALDTTESDDYYTEDVINVICSADLSKMKTSLLEGVLNQKKQELLSSPDIGNLLSALQKQRQDEKAKAGTARLTHGGAAPPDDTVNDPLPLGLGGEATPVPIDLTSSPKTSSEPTSDVAGCQGNRTQGMEAMGQKGGNVGNPSSVSVVGGDSKPQTSHISVHPNVYMLNRQTGAGSKTQARLS